MTFADAGNAALLFAFVVACYGTAASLLAARGRLPELLHSARHAVVALAALLTVAACALFHALLTHDFSLRYVYEHSSRAMPELARLTSFWGGQQGSLLLWAWGLAVLSLVVVWRLPVPALRAASAGPASHGGLEGRWGDLHLAPYVIATLLAIQTFFLFVLGFVGSPFERLEAIPSDGRGLNPLLMDPAMRVHPPLLLLGYMSFSVPFAFAIAALASGQVGRSWLRAGRAWMLLAWTIQGCGLLMGAWWAYRVLGWGGYWGWDPVENVALLPWLTATAFLHTLLVQERRGLLKVWTMALAIATFALAIFGTFVVRSGVLTSVHSFALSPIGPYFFGFLGVVLIGATALLLYRLPLLRAEGQIDAVLSREAGFLLNNLLLVGLAAAVFWGTVFPLLSEAVRGVKVAVGPPYYQQVTGPLLVGLLLLMGGGPLLAWRRTSPERLARQLGPPLAVAGAVGLGMAALGIERGLALVGAAACAFVAATVALEYWHGLRARQRGGESGLRALGTLVARGRRRYGGYLVHLAMVLIAIGVLGSGHQLDRLVTLAPGEQARVGAFTLTYDTLYELRGPGYEGVLARLQLGGPRGEYLGTLQPDRRVYANWEQQPVSTIAIQTTLPWLQDVYVVLTEADASNRVTLHVYVNPLVVCVWLGGVLFLLGTLVAAWPEARGPRAAVGSAVAVQPAATAGATQEGA
ncbi:MAG TPA: cytochrome c-type biogenesis CcmF C-terminal domain-containing protein [Chloroflexota bacterium]|nr:cytochrome c-type biogenesis CcmF C-terminal domain-containing protein [Chloroflexota bacterium]